METVTCQQKINFFLRLFKEARREKGQRERDSAKKSFFLKCFTSQLRRAPETFGGSISVQVKNLIRGCTPNGSNGYFTCGLGEGDDVRAESSHTALRWYSGGATS